MKTNSGGSCNALYIMLLAVVALLAQGCQKSAGPEPVVISSVDVVMQDINNDGDWYFVFNTAQQEFVDSFSLRPYTGLGQLSAEKDRMFVKQGDSIIVVDLATSERVDAMFTVRLRPIWWPVISPNGETFATSVIDSGLMIYDAHDLSRIARIPSGVNGFRDFKYSYAGDRIYAIESAEKKLSVYRIGESVTMEYTFPVRNRPLWVAGSSNGTLAAALVRGQGAMHLEVYDLLEHSLIFDGAIDSSDGGMIQFSRDDRYIFISNPGDKYDIYGSHGDYSLSVFDIDSNTLIKRINVRDGLLGLYHQSENGELLIGMTLEPEDVRISIINLNSLSLEVVVIPPEFTFRPIRYLTGEL
ncbi:hypothetical protein JYT16_01215 [Gemmatimonas aurantiaca]|nr:hypothetical protein [Gemmatimonas aurantiaca]